MKLGTSYYPELFDEDSWASDLRLMKETGIDIIRIFDFAWTTVESKEGVYDWSWLDRFLDLCTEVEMEVILCTPTATPPAWLHRQYPDIMGVRRDGTRRVFGGRRDVCNTSEVYRHYSVGIARRMAERYGQHKAVVAWQIDNELFGNEDATTECHCEQCNYRFRVWLKERYATIEELNEAWGLRYWNQGFDIWGEVTTPQHDHCVDGWVIDYTEFFSDMIAEYMKLQYDMLKENISPDQWVFHNSTGVVNIGLDHRKYSRLMDAGAWDAYPTAAGTPLPDTFTGLAHEMFRSACDKPFHVLASPSQRIRHSFLSECFARGANSVLFWHWRCYPAGVENAVDTICHYDGRPKEDRINQIRDFKEKIKKIPPLPEALPKQETAFIYDVTNVRKTRRQTNWRNSNYLTTLPKTYYPLWQHGILVDVLAPRECLDGYKLVVVPGLQLIDKETSELFTEYVRNGGVMWVCAPFAQCDEHAKWLLDSDALVGEMLGINQLDPKARGESLVNVDGVGDFKVEHSSMLIEPTTATVLGRFTDGDYAGEAAVTVHSCGKGKVYFAACVSQTLGAWMMDQALAEAGIKGYDNDSEDLTIVPHLSGQGTWYCNHADTSQAIDGITVPANDFAFVKQQKI